MCLAYFGGNSVESSTLSLFRFFSVRLEVCWFLYIADRSIFQIDLNPFTKRKRNSNGRSKVLNTNNAMLLTMVSTILFVLSTILDGENCSRKLATALVIEDTR